MTNDNIPEGATPRLSDAKDHYSVAMPDKSVDLRRPGQRWSILVSGHGKADMVNKEQTVGNPYDHSIYIRKIIVWNGIDFDAHVDMWTRIWACGGIYVPPMVIWSHSWDRYERTAFHKPFKHDCGDGFIEIIEGGWLTFSAQCIPIGPQPWPWPNDPNFPPPPGGYVPGYAVQFEIWFEATHPLESRGTSIPVK
jgi:hypothetical protein